MTKRLILAGAGHAHLTTIYQLKAFTGLGVDVTVISKTREHYYSGMGPGALSGIYQPEEIRFPVAAVVARNGGRFIEGAVTGVDPHQRKLFLESGAALSYDIASFNTGSAVFTPVPHHPRLFPVKPIENLLAARKRLLEAGRRGRPAIVVAGGGPAGVEMAANTRALLAGRKAEGSITLIAGKRLLPRFPGRMQRLARESLVRMNITVLENQRLSGIDGNQVLLSGGGRLPAQIVFLATGTRPSPLFAHSALPTGPEGGLLVDPFLRSVAFPNLFGGGDCIDLQIHPVDRVGVYAVRQNPILFHNLLATATGRGRLKPFHPQNIYMLILNMGGRTGILYRPPFVMRNRAAFLIKDWIDRRFMRRFGVQV